MKRIFLLMLAALCIVFVSCEKDTVEPNEDLPSEEETVTSEEPDVPAELDGAEITEPFLSVLKGDKPFYSWGKDETYFTETYDYDGEKFIEKNCKYTFVDLNADGKEELIIQSIDNVVLSDEGDRVFGFCVNFRSLGDLCENGTFSWNYTAYDGLHYGTTRYNTDWTTVELYSVHDDSENNTTKYYVEGKEVTKEEWDSYAAKVDGQQVAWFPLDWTKLN